MKHKESATTRAMGGMTEAALIKEAMKKAKVLRKMGEEYQAGGYMEDSKRCFISAASVLEGIKTDAAFDLKFACNMALATIGTIKKPRTASSSQNPAPIPPPDSPFVETRLGRHSWGGYANPPTPVIDPKKAARTGILPTVLPPPFTASTSSVPQTSSPSHASLRPGGQDDQQPPATPQPLSVPSTARSAAAASEATPPAGVEVGVNTRLAGAAGRSSLEKAKDLGEMTAFLNSGTLGASIGPSKVAKGVQTGVQKFRPTWDGPDVASQRLQVERLRNERINPPRQLLNTHEPREIPEFKFKQAKAGVQKSTNGPEFAYKLRRFDVDTKKLQAGRQLKMDVIPVQQRRTHAINSQQALELASKC